MKKIIDERQELEMMKVERTGFWIMSICALFAISIFFLMFVVLFLMGTFTKYRQKKLARQFDDDTDFFD